MTAATQPTRREALDGHVREGDFRHAAACRAVDPEVFFPAADSGPGYTAAVRSAKAVCAGCPVREQCLSWALSSLPDGIAGGMTEQERRTERVRRARTGRATSAVSAATGKGAPAATDAPVLQISHGTALQGTRAAEGGRS
jgi:hypothetical protein